MVNLKPYRRSDLVFNNNLNEMYNMIDSFFGGDRLTALENSSFKIDIKDTEDAYIIEAELPGFDKDEIDVEVEKGRLTISANKEEEIDNSDEKTNYIHRERRTSSMSRSMTFKDMNEEKLKAELDDGILTIEVPKLVRENQVKKIEIK